MDQRKGIMSRVDVKPSRSWREIAQLAANEQNPQKVLQLAQELIRALDLESDEQMGKITAAQKAEKGAA